MNPWLLKILLLGNRRSNPWCTPRQKVQPPSKAKASIKENKEEQIVKHKTRFQVNWLVQKVQNRRQLKKFCIFFLLLVFGKLVEVTAIQVKIEWHKIRWKNGSWAENLCKKGVANAKTGKFWCNLQKSKGFLQLTSMIGLVSWEMIKMVLKASVVLSCRKADNQVKHCIGQCSSSI